MPIWSDYAWETDPVSLASRADVDVLVEVMGGHEGAAKDATEAALRAGKDVVTANKALLAHHGQALAELAESLDRAIRFEAAVAGGIPVNQDPQRGTGWQCDTPRNGRDEWHLQLHPDADGRGWPAL